MLCPVMQLDFTDRWGRYDDRGVELYSDEDLRYGILWAESHLADGLTKEPMKDFDLIDFRRWCRKKLRMNLSRRPTWLAPARGAAPRASEVITLDALLLS